MIAVSPVPAGPFGQDRRYGPVEMRVNGLVHQLRAAPAPSIHDFSTRVDKPWTTAHMIGREQSYPPIANISIRGRREDVASVRSSE